MANNWMGAKPPKMSADPSTPPDKGSSQSGSMDWKGTGVDQCLDSKPGKMPGAPTISTAVPSVNGTGKG